MSAFIEELSMNAWPSITTRLYDGWVLRFSEGYTKRANSVNPLYPSTLPVEEKIISCEKIYSSFHLPAVFKITDDKTQHEIDKQLSLLCYKKCGVTSVQVLTLDDYNFNITDNVRIEYNFSDEWINGYISCSEIEQHWHKTLKNMLAKIPEPRVIASIKKQGEIVACGYGAIEHGYIGIFNLDVKKEFRKLGFGWQILNGILSAGKEMEAKYSYLQVVNGNETAEKLYRKTGYKESYKYWYRIKSTF